jgi:hypothetical protein
LDELMGSPLAEKSAQNRTLGSMGGGGSDIDNSMSGNTSSRSSSSGERDLEPFAFEEATSALASLDLSKTGWSVEDMLVINKTKYGYKSTFNADMSEYTMPVRRENTAEYRRREAEAERLAREIESDYNYKLNVDKELSDGEDEELAFSAVHRGGDSERTQRSNAKSRHTGNQSNRSSNNGARSNNQRKSSNNSPNNNNNNNNSTSSQSGKGSRRGVVAKNK